LEKRKVTESLELGRKGQARKKGGLLLKEKMEKRKTDENGEKEKEGSERPA